MNFLTMIIIRSSNYLFFLITAFSGCSLWENPLKRLDSVVTPCQPQLIWDFDTGNTTSFAFGFDFKDSILAVVGYAPGGTTGKASVSLDKGATWVHSYPTNFGQGDAALILQNNSVLVSGISNTLQGQVFQSTDGSTWNTIDEYGEPPANRAYAASMAQLSDLDLLWTGYGNQFGAGGVKWVTRKSTNGGQNWYSVDSFQNEVGANSEASWIARIDNSTAVSVGKGTAAGEYHWIARKSTDSGETWTTVDDFDYGTSSVALFALATSSDVIFVAGYGDPGTGLKHALIRRSTDGGATWATVDDFTNGTENIYNDIAVDKNGIIYVLGSTVISGNTETTVRFSTDNGMTWASKDNYIYTAGKNTKSYAIRSSNSEIFAALTGTDSLNNNHWLLYQYCSP
jgi:hypothetical protein